MVLHVPVQLTVCACSATNQIRVNMFTYLKYFLEVLMLMIITHTPGMVMAPGWSQNANISLIFAIHAGFLRTSEIFTT